MDKLKECPFCGKQPKIYVIGARPSFGEKGQMMVKCINSDCALWDKSFYLTKWNIRFQEQPSKSKLEKAREIWCNGCVWKDSYCPDKKAHHCNIVDQALQQFTPLFEPLEKGDKSEAILDAIRKVKVGDNMIIHNKDMSVWCILKKVCEEHEETGG